MNPEKIYLKELKRSISLFTPNRHRFITEMKTLISDYSADSNQVISYEFLVNAMGKPSDLVNNFYESQSSAEQLKIRRFYKLIIIALVVLTVVISTVSLYFAQHTPHYEQIDSINIELESSSGK